MSSFPTSDRSAVGRLAIEGGQPVIPNGPPEWPSAEMNAAIAPALASLAATGDWGRYDGPHLSRLEAAAAALTGQTHALAVCSGTYAVELALRACRIDLNVPMQSASVPDPEVIVAAYDFPGNFRAIEAIGARPVLVDVVSSGWVIDCQQLDAAWSPQVQAVIASHLHGQLADMPTLAAWCRERKIALIEDACQSPSATIAGRPAGSFGDVSVLSFGGSKLLTAGRGGAIATSHDACLQRAKVAIERGNRAFPLSELQAAVLLAQWPIFPAQQQRRHAAVARLRDALTMPELKMPELKMVGPQPDGEGSYYKVGFQLATREGESLKELAARRDRWSARLRAEGVAIDAGFRGFASRTSNRCRRVGELDSAQQAAAATLLLHHPVLLESDATIDRVAQAIVKVADADPAS